MTYLPLLEGDYDYDILANIKRLKKLTPRTEDILNGLLKLIPDSPKTKSRGTRYKKKEKKCLRMLKKSKKPSQYKINKEPKKWKELEKSKDLNGKVCYDLLLYLCGYGYIYLHSV